MLPSLPGRSFVWMSTFWAIALRNILLVSAIPGTVIFDDQDTTRIEYTLDQQWFHDPLKGWESDFYNGSRSYTWDYGASAIFRFTGVGINITGPTAPDQALRMVLLNNVSMGIYAHETPEREPSTSFFLSNLDYGNYIVEVRHVDTRPMRILAIDTFRVIVDNDLYPTASVGSSNPSDGINSPSQSNTATGQPNLTINTASISGNHSSDPYSTGMWSDPSVPGVRFSPSIMALIIVLSLLFVCLVCSIGIWLWMRRRRRSSRRAFPDTTEKAATSGQGYPRHDTSSNLSEFGVEAQTIREQPSVPPTMGPNAAAAILEAHSSVDALPQRRQLAIILPTSHSESAARYPPGPTPPTTPPASGVAPSQPLVSSTEPRRSMSPTAFFARLSQNFAAVFRGPPQDSAASGDDTDTTSVAESYSTPMALGMRLNYQPAATAESTLHGSDTEAGSTKENKLRASIASDWDMIDGSTRAPSFSSRASLGHSQSHGRLRRGDPLPPYALDITGDSLAPGSAQSGQLSSSASTGMVTALTHQTIDLTP